MKNVNDLKKIDFHSLYYIRYSAENMRENRNINGNKLL